MAKQNTPVAESKASAPAPAVAATPVQTAGSAPTAQQESAPVNATAQFLGTGRFTKFVPEVVKIVTMPLLKMKIGEPCYVKFLDKTFVGKELKNEPKVGPDGKPLQKKDPPVMAHVIDLSTGEQADIMLGKVLQGILDDDYPQHAYVGKCFMIELKEQKRGRSGGNYNTYSVAEIKDPTIQ